MKRITLTLEFPEVSAEEEAFTFALIDYVNLKAIKKIDNDFAITTNWEWSY